MNEQIYTVISTVIGGAIVLVGQHFTAKKELALKEKELEDKRSQQEKEFAKSEMYFLREKLEELHIILSYVALENSQTMSCIQSSEKISLSKFRENYINLCNELHTAKASALYFPEIQNKIDSIYGQTNIYWGTQEALLNTDIIENRKVWQLHCQQIIKVSTEINNLVNECSALISNELNYLLIKK